MVVYYISGHGFGHASRSLEVIRALLSKHADLRITIKSTAPAWLFAGAPEVTVERFESDVGMVQPDSVSVDVKATAVQAAGFYREFDRRADIEGARLRAAAAQLVVGDIPPLAHAAAASAGIPSIAIGNFTWDWIYAGCDGFEQNAPGVIDLIRDAYRESTLALRLPMHGGFDSVARMVDIPMIARRSTRDRADTRRIMKIPDDRPFALASFAAYGLGAPFDEIASREGLSVVSSSTPPPSPLAYEDLVAAADVVISKPGYGIVSECVANDTPLLYTSRGQFIEYDVFVAEMPRVLRCRFIPQDDLRSGRWRSHIDALRAQPAAPERARVDGANVASELISSEIRRPTIP